ncbi:restriction endonuclease subunit S, partial [Apilactobacillus sp. EABW-1NA]|uniref:restriction endonuclease subunit S n=1 Tax=Apilactobacillus sp. EABW-1NA TaxID=2984137 RepID=UPI0025B166FC
MAYKKLPDLRFSGFSDEWKEIKFSEIYTKSYGGGTPSKKNQDFWNDGTIPWFQSSDLVEGKLTKENVNKKISEKAIVKSSVKVIPGGSIAIVTRVGVGKLALIDFDYSTSQDFLSISGFKTKTMYALYLIYNLMNVLKNSLQGTSIKGITKPELNSKRIRISTDSLEQQKIGEFFIKQDKLIELQTQKVDQLKKLKRGYLQKMFPQEGETVPRLRFSGFSGEWKEEKLGDKLCVKMGQSPHSENYTDDNKNSILVQGNADILNGKIKPRVYTKEITRTSKKDEIIMTVRAPVGELAFNQFDNVVIGRGVASLSGNKFDYYSLVNIKDKGLWKRFSSGSTFDSINSSDIKLMTIKVPKEDEQQKIGTFFSKLDKLIKQQSRK